VLTLRPRHAPETVADPPRWGRSLTARVDARAAIALGAAWFVLVPVAAALEPEASRSDPTFAVALGVLANVVFVAMLVGLALLRRWGLLASLAGAALATAMALACPTTGHHPFGLWWIGQMACVGALVLGSVIALRLPEPAASTPEVG
jgi:hypothetical protein